MRHILIVDDDIHINRMLERILTKEGYRVSHAYSGTEALLFLKTCRPELVLLDRMLPGLAGDEVLPQMADIPVIIMSAKDDVKGKVELLLGGAADYITKPFEIEELLARIEVQFRKMRGSLALQTIDYDGISLDPATHEVRVCGQEVRLTRTEFAILKILMENPRQVITKTLLLERISEDTPDCMENSLRVHVSNLRRKLKEASGKDHIEAVWGIGFKMAES